MASDSFYLGHRDEMNQETTIKSRRGEVPCGDKDLYAFLTDMRNFALIAPEKLITGFEASEDKCSFRLDKAGKISIELSEALPHSSVNYLADTFITGKASVTVIIDHMDYNHSGISLSVNIQLNPLVKMIIGNSPEKYLDELISAIEAYDGFDKIKGCTQFL